MQGSTRLIALVALLCSSPAAAPAAAPRAFWQSRPISPQAVADDPSLASFQTFDLMVELRGSRFSFGDLIMTLPSGVIYNHPFGTNLPQHPDLVALFPAVGFDTYVTVPPGASCLVRSAFGAANAAILSGNTIDVSMFSENFTSAVATTGTHLIGRFTFTAGVVPELQFGQVVSIGFPPSPIPPIPEPAVGGWVACATATAWIGRRRKRPHAPGKN